MDSGFLAGVDTELPIISSKIRVSVGKTIVTNIQASTMATTILNIDFMGESSILGVGQILALLGALILLIVVVYQISLIALLFLLVAIAL